MENNYCVIMAGGIGSRFWPLSKSNFPKQFIDILGIGKSLIRLTFERFRAICPIENYYIVTNEAYKSIILEQIPELKEEQILCEPLRRNTAPCIMYANYIIGKKNKNAKIIVAPSDHLILNENEFNRVINYGLDYAANNDVLLTLGIQPTRPDTGYGYIQLGEKSITDINKVKTFTEKPNLDMAKFFLESGEFYWNSGIFIWSLASIDKAFQDFLPDVYNLFQKSSEFSCESDFINATYSDSPSISIDYGVMEKADNVYVLRADFGWSDLGTWGSLYENKDKDKHTNAVIGDNVFLYDTKNSIVRSNANKIIVVQGLEDYIVVDSEQSLLICKKTDEQKIKIFVNDIKQKLGDTYV
ncbi:MAG: mannose-1-phosphate guanylyltransferase [Bacteroidales bacterium]|nr:mannose-1-phosphate guanylyltransferase [Bacteroidales bacterium]